MAASQRHAWVSLWGARTVDIAGTSQELGSSCPHQRVSLLECPSLRCGLVHEERGRALGDTRERLDVYTR